MHAQSSRQECYDARRHRAKRHLHRYVQGSQSEYARALSDDGPQGYSVLEYCAPGSLDESLVKDRNLIEAGVPKAKTGDTGDPNLLNLCRKQIMQIALGIVQGLVHLHTMQPPMVHQDVKTGKHIIVVKKYMIFVGHRIQFHLFIYYDMPLANVLLTKINHTNMVSATKIAGRSYDES